MPHLLALSVGPVQEFIAAARRTRDLWCGSFLLSEVSKAAAKAVHDTGGSLIFPAPQAAKDLDEGSELNVANVILAELRTAKPDEVAKAARDAARARWKSFAEEAHGEAGNVIRADVWKEQVDDVIEFAAAWCPFTAVYKDDRARVMRLLAGRKNARDFHPAGLRPGLPKSSLDGLRDTLLADSDRKLWPKKLRLRAGEQLDVVGLTKRLAAGTQSYPSVSRVAADPWVRGLFAAGGREALSAFVSACQNAPRDLVHRLDTAVFPQSKDYPVEGTTLFRKRHHEWFEESGELPDRLGERRKVPEWYTPIDKALDEVEGFASGCGVGPEPNPYLAVLVADGDHVGATIAQLHTPDEHRQFSAQLARFAGEARDIVHKHSGVLVYAGGDDVFAFLPVDTCLKCARELHNRFGSLMDVHVSKLNATREQKLEAHMTLSVGIAIGHFMENLEDLRRYGQAAERHAKRSDADGNKDALAVHLHKRGGPVEVHAKWSADPDARMRRSAELFLDRSLPSRLPYDLRRMADVYRDWPAATAREAIRRDVLRLVAAKAGSGAAPARVADAVRDRVTDADALRAFAAELLVARQVAVALRQAGAIQNGGAR